ncbi:MAG: hypothetical protein JW885_02580 [Deltaproteobacteria bacterium]|nr:hypothetical protein [Candidatus Zymogenaceae bacterium]
MTNQPHHTPRQACVAIRIADYYRYLNAGETYLMRTKKLPPDAECTGAFINKRTNMLNIIYESDRFDPVSGNQSPPVIYTWDVILSPHVR